ncbi:ion transporter [Palleronia pontilimi]|uniref:ion transporter n=1 Tax=Palleronia pontilimi TaxID=1964209 RepID=UPI001BE4BDCC
MKSILQTLYEGDGTGPRAFRIALVIFDLVTIAYFLATATSDLDTRLLVIDLVVAAVVLVDLGARLWIAERRMQFLLKLTTLADLIVVLSLLAPLIAGSNFGFLRVLRVLRLVRSFHLIEQLDKATQHLDINRRVVRAALNLAAFIFVVTSLVWVWEHDRNDNVETYIDALYFTITTLTTTGYGDIILTDRVGRILTICIMIFGVGFFLNLLQAIYRPNKVEQKCPECGLELHDRDASHCKHCGNTIYIETEGET